MHTRVEDFLEILTTFNPKYRKYCFREAKNKYPEIARVFVSNMCPWR